MPLTVTHDVRAPRVVFGAGALEPVEIATPEVGLAS